MLLPCDRQQKGPARHTSQNQTHSGMWKIIFIPTGIIYILPAKPQTYRCKVTIFSLVVFSPSPSALSQCLPLFKGFLQSQWQEEVALDTEQEPPLPPSSGSLLCHVKLGKNHTQRWVPGAQERPLPPPPARACRNQSWEVGDAHHKTYIYELRCFSNTTAKASSLPFQLALVTLNVQPTAPHSPCLLRRQWFSQDGWGVAQHRSGLQVMVGCQGTPLTWHSYPTSTHPSFLHFMNLPKGNRRASKMISNLAIRKGNLTFKPLLGDWKEANTARAYSNALQ